MKLIEVFCCLLFRVLELEKKKEEVERKEKVSKKRVIVPEEIPSDNESDDNAEAVDIDEYLDWRAKNAYK